MKIFSKYLLTIFLFLNVALFANDDSAATQPKFVGKATKSHMPIKKKSKIGKIVFAGIIVTATIVTFFLVKKSHQDHKNR